MNFKDNPFWILDASPRDSKQVLHDKAENKSFELPEDVCRNAENILLAPKKRLEAELSWFPGISPKKTKELLAQIEEDAQNGNYDSTFFWDLENLVYANALALFISSISVENLTKECIKEIIEDFCIATSELDDGEVLIAINEDRMASGFVTVQDEDTIAQGLQAQMHFYKQELRSFLEPLDFLDLANILTQIIENVTENGNTICEWGLLEDFIADYELDANPFFEKQEEKIDLGIAELAKSLSEKAELKRELYFIEKLEKDLYLWDKIAQPIQVWMKSRGVEHKRSSALAIKIRAFAISVYNDYGKAEFSERISKLLQNVFAEVPIIAEAVSEDLGFLTTTGRDNEQFDHLIKILETYDITPTTAESVTDTFSRCWSEAYPIVEKLHDIGAGKNYLAAFFLKYIVRFANKNQEIEALEASLTILKKISPLVTDADLLKQINKNKRTLRANLDAKIKKKKEDEEAEKYGFIWGMIASLLVACGVGVLISIFSRSISTKTAVVNCLIVGGIIALCILIERLLLARYKICIFGTIGYIAAGIVYVFFAGFGFWVAVIAVCYMIFCE